MVKVLVVGVNYAPEPTGIAPYTSKMAAGLARRGHGVRVLTTMPHYPAWRIEADHRRWRVDDRVDDVAVRRMLHYVPSRPSGARRALSEVTFGLRVVAASWARPDVVLTVSPALLSAAAVMARHRLTRSGAGFGVVVQDLYAVGLRETAADRGLSAGAIASAERRLLLSVDGVSVIHPAFADAVAQLGVDREAVRVIRNWTHVVDPGPLDLRAVRHRLGWRDDEHVVLHTGAMGQKQGLENVVDAARLAARDQPGIRFVLAGNGGQRRKLEARAAGVENLQLLDPLPDELYAGALRAADVLLVNELPGSGQMAVPSKLTSYFSSGTPVVAAVEAGGTTSHEMVASGAGVVVSPGRPAELVGAVAALRSEPVRASRLGSRGPAYSRSVLSEEAALGAYDEWVHELAARGAARRRR